MTKKHTEHEEHEVHQAHKAADHTHKSGDHAPKAADHAPEADDATATTANTATFVLTKEQNDFVGTLTSKSAFDVTHTQKVGSDVASVFTPQLLQTISANPALGGPARAATIQALLDQQTKLLGVNAVIVPLAQLVSQNLLSVNAQLAQNLSQTLKIAEALERTEPDLAKAFKPAEDWNKSHHATHHAAKKPDPSPTPAPPKS